MTKKREATRPFGKSKSSNSEFKISCRTVPGVSQQRSASPSPAPARPFRNWSSAVECSGVSQPSALELAVGGGGRLLLNGTPEEQAGGPVLVLGRRWRMPASRPGAGAVIVCRTGARFRSQTSPCSAWGPIRPERHTMTASFDLLGARGDGEDGVSTTVRRLVAWQDNSKKRSAGRRSMLFAPR
jgi:hypothetical protein